jgi:hypothetical protein
MADTLGHFSFFVVAGLVPAIHVLAARKTWMPGTRPGMTQRALICAPGNAGPPGIFSTAQSKFQFASGRQVTDINRAVVAWGRWRPPKARRTMVFAAQE